MIFERRAYTMEPGHVPAFDKAQTDRGFDLVKSYMDRLVGYFSTRSGPADQVVHLYRYDSFEDWNTRLRGLYAVPELTPYFVNTRKIVRRQVTGFLADLAGNADWQAFIAAIAPLLTGQSSLLLTPRPVPEMSPLFS